MLLQWAEEGNIQVDAEINEKRQLVLKIVKKEPGGPYEILATATLGFWRAERIAKLILAESAINPEAPQK